MDFYRPATTQGTLDGLATFYRAVRAWRFYPKGHPTRRSALILAHSVLLELLDGNTLSLVCGRTGFSFPDGESIKDASWVTAALAYELFVRRIQKISIFPDLHLEDLVELCRILNLSPEEIQLSGGIDAMMAARGVRTIWVNEFDLAVIRGKRQKVEQTGIIPQGIDEVEQGGDSTPVFEPQSSQPDAPLPELQLQAVMERLTTCNDDDIYLMLTRQAVTCADNLRSFHESHLLLPLIDLLVRHSRDNTRSEIVRERAQFAIEQIMATGEILQIVLARTERGDEVSKETLQAVLTVGGAAAIAEAVELMGRTSNLKVRKMLSTILGSLGEAAVPVLLDLMHDTRWFITRNICAILGSIASRTALTALTKCLHHPDLRVRKEALRSLAHVGGHEAEAAILAVLRGTDAAVHRQAIASLGGMKSRRSLVELMKIACSRDLFLKSLPIKIDALAAIASIGDRQVTPHLIALLEERHLLAAARGKLFKAAIASCLGKLGETRAVPILKNMASAGGELGSACSEALLMIEKSEGRPDESP